MDEYDDTSTNLMILPGVDLALWLRLAALLVAVSVAGLVTVAVR